MQKKTAGQHESVTNISFKVSLGGVDKKIKQEL